MNVEGELQQLVGEIKRLGSRGPNGHTSVPFGKLVNDERCSQIFEALVGTLRAGKKRGWVTYDKELLLAGLSDGVEIVLLREETAAA